MELKSYRKKIVPLLIGCISFNFFILLMLKFLEKLGLGKIYFIGFFVSIIVNSIFSIFNQKVLYERIEYILSFNETKLRKIFLIISMYFIPLWGIYLVFKTFQNLETKSLLLKNLLITRFFPLLAISILVLIASPFLKTKKNIPANYLNLAITPTANYLVSTIYDARQIFKFKEEIIRMCTVEKMKPICIFQEIERRNADKLFNITEIILYIAVDASELFKFKNKLPKEEQFLVAEFLIDHNIQFLEMACNRHRLAWDYGFPSIDFILGNITATTLDIINELIHKELVQTALPRLTIIAQSLNDKKGISSYVKKIEDFKNSNCYRAHTF